MTFNNFQYHHKEVVHEFKNLHGSLSNEIFRI